MKKTFIKILTLVLVLSMAFSVSAADFEAGKHQDSSVVNIKGRIAQEDINGNIEIRTPFWPECRTFDKIPCLLIYADLLAEDDSRCTGTAGEIFNRFLRGEQ